MRFKLFVLNFSLSPAEDVLGKRCSGYMQQIYRRAPKPKCNFNKVAFQLY